jgi:hypothetical protein
VAARNALVKSLRKEGRRDDATAVAALRRPSPASWSLNQVARHEADVVGEALDAGAKLQAATARAVSGKRGDLRSAQEAQRRALDAVLDAAMARGRELGAANLDQLRRRAGNTLHAAVADGAIGAQLRAGRLDEDLDPPGFGFGFGAAPAVDEPVDVAGDEHVDDGGDEAEPTRADRAAEDEETDAARRAAEEHALAVQRAAIEKRIARLERDADRLEESARRAEQSAREARGRADTAARAVADARAELETLS